MCNKKICDLEYEDENCIVVRVKKIWKTVQLNENNFDELNRSPEIDVFDLIRFQGDGNFQERCV